MTCQDESPCRHWWRWKDITQGFSKKYIVGICTLFVTERSTCQDGSRGGPVVSCVTYGMYSSTLNCKISREIFFFTRYLEHISVRGWVRRLGSRAKQVYCMGKSFSRRNRIAVLWTNGLEEGMQNNILWGGLGAEEGKQLCCPASDNNLNLQVSPYNFAEGSVSLQPPYAAD